MGKDAARIRQEIARDVFDYQVLLDVLSEYKKPRDKIGRLLTDGTVVRIKKGLYCFGEGLRRRPISREQVANLIYGPSYVSMESALSYHGLIPERVEMVTSVTTCRSRRFDTPVGAFSYRMLAVSRYALGASLETAGNRAFLIAGPEKALADKVWTDARCPGRRVSNFESYLFEDLRIDAGVLSGFDRARFRNIAQAYASAKINNLLRYLQQFWRKSDA